MIAPVDPAPIADQLAQLEQAMRRHITPTSNGTRAWAVPITIEQWADTLRSIQQQMQAESEAHK